MKLIKYDNSTVARRVDVPAIHISRVGAISLTASLCTLLGVKEGDGVSLHQDAEAKHPVMGHDLVHRSAVVAEEAGELVRASLMHHYERGHIEELRKEAIQTAAMAIKFQSLHVFMYSRAKVAHAMVNGVTVLRLVHERRSNYNEPWRQADKDYIIAGTKKDFCVKCESDVEAMVEAFKAGKESFKL